MAYSAIPTRDTDDTNSFADINQLQDNIDYLYDRTPVQENHFIYGLEISNDTDADHDIQVAVGSAIDSTFALKLELSSAITKQIDAAWAVGDDQGGLDTGSVAADTWYYIWIIYRSDTQVTDVLFSTSATSPTMPANYDYKRRIRGAVLTNGSANILGFYQKDDHFWFKARIQDVSNTSPGTSRNLAVMSVPPNMVGIFTSNINDSGTTYILIGCPSETDVAPTTVLNDIYVDPSSYKVNIHKNILTNASSQIYYRSNNASIVYQFVIYTLGFIDPAQS